MKKLVVLVGPTCLAVTCAGGGLSGRLVTAVRRRGRVTHDASPGLHPDRDHHARRTGERHDQRRRHADRHLDVDETTNLRGRQEIDVSWSGAHPTGGIVADQNSIAAQNEEYPFVLLECRGIGPPACAPTSGQSRDLLDADLDRALPGQPSARRPTRRTGWTSTRRAADCRTVVGAPLPTADRVHRTSESAPVQHWVPFVAARRRRSTTAGMRAARRAARGDRTSAGRRSRATRRSA